MSEPATKGTKAYQFIFTPYPESQQPAIDYILLLNLATLQTVIALVLAYHVQDVSVHVLPGLFRLDPNRRLNTYDTKFHNEPTFQTCNTGCQRVTLLL